MHIEFLVEEYSAEVLLKNLLPSMLPDDTSFTIHAFSGKYDLLDKLPKRLQGYRKWLPETWRLVVLIDNDGKSRPGGRSYRKKRTRQSYFETANKIRKNVTI